jgi:hypothetical protein
MRHRGRPRRIARAGGRGNDSTVSQSDYERGRGRTSTTALQGIVKMASMRGSGGIMAPAVEPGLRRAQRLVRLECTDHAKRKASSRRAGRTSPRLWHSVSPGPSIG